MAWLKRRGQKYRLSFRYDGRTYRHSLGSANEKEDGAYLARLEEGIRLLERGRLHPPSPDADLTLYLLPEGKVSARPDIAPASEALTLATLAERFKAAQATTLEANSHYTGGIRLRHVIRSLGANFLVPDLTLAHLQAHVDRRARQRGPWGKPLSPVTIRKEIKTLGAAWAWAVQGKTLSGTYPNTCSGRTRSSSPGTASSSGRSRSSRSGSPAGRAATSRR